MSGASAPTSLPSLGSETDGLAFDGSGNLYAAYRNGKKQAGIEYYALGTTIPKDLGISLDQPQGLVIDPAGNVLVAQTGGVNTVDVFPPGQTTPSQQISFSGAPTELALTSSGSTLFVSVLPGAIDKVPLSRPTPLALITGLENLQGVAITPGF
jgi:DNA-binding beta-propeller fold protein YncE